MPNDFFDEATPLARSGASILVVDDDTGTLRLERFVLEEAGYDVQEAKSGEEALEALNESGAALVLLDIGLPGMDGFTACRRIRETHQIPIIIVSAENKSEHIVRGLGLGADDYLTKPFSTTELAARVKAVLRRYNFVMLQARAAKADPASDPQGNPTADSGASGDGGTGESRSTEAATCNLYEGSVSLVVRTSGVAGGMFHFVADLRQNPSFRIMRLNADHQAQSIEISLRLREPLELKSIILQMNDVSQVIEPSDTLAEGEERIFQVNLGG